MRRPCYTKSSLVKLAFRSGELSLSMAELEQRLEQLKEEFPQFVSNPLKELPSHQIIQDVLAKEGGPIMFGTSQAIVQLKQSQNSLADRIVLLFQQRKHPLTTEQIRQHLWKRHLIGHMKAPLPLEEDIRFLQVEGDERWFLRSWFICNDQVYQLLRAEGMKGGRLQEIVRMMEQRWQMPRERYLFLPEIDSRFKVWEEQFLIDDEDIVEEVQIQDKGENYHMENLENQQPVFTTVVQQLEHSIQLLKERNQVMQEEVLQSFTANNMEEIQRLMAEKQQNEQALHDLEQVLQQWKGDMSLQ